MRPDVEAAEGPGAVPCQTAMMDGAGKLDGEREADLFGYRSWYAKIRAGSPPILIDQMRIQ